MLNRTRGPVERLVRRHQTPLVLAALTLLVLGGLWAHDAATRIERRTSVAFEGAWAEEAAFRYTVPVVVDSPAYPNGTVLGMGMPGYFSTVSPAVDLTFSWRLREPRDAPLAAAATLVVRVAAESPDGRAYFVTERPLDARQHAGVAGDRVELAGVLDVPAVARDADAAAAAVGFRGPMRWDVLATVRFSALGSGASVRNDSVYVLPVGVSGPLYVLPDEAGASFARSGGRQVVSVVEHRPGARAVLDHPGALAAAGAGLLVLALVARAARRDRLERADPHGAFLAELADHEAWIARTGAPLPSPTPGDVEVASLRDLVALAAEARTRVLLDETSRVFEVRAPGARYRYSRHAHAPAPGLAIVSPPRAGG